MINGIGVYLQQSNDSVEYWTGVIMDKWQGKIVVVTGASAGIGQAILQDLVNSGLTVIGLARRVEKIDVIIFTF